MLKRIILEEWHHALPMVGFLFFFGFFCYFSIRAYGMRKEEERKYSMLPFENDSALEKDRTDG